MRFANTTIMDKDTCRDFEALNWSINAGVFRILLLAVGAFSIFWSVFQVVNKGWIDLFSVVGIFVMGLIALFLGQWGYLLRVKRYTKIQQELWGADTLKKDVLFFEDVFVQTSKLGELTFDYSQVTKLVANKRSIVIRLGHSALLLKRDGFSVGTEAEFIAFMQQKIKDNKRNAKNKPR